MKVLVTGGAGFIGSNLVRRLESEAAIGEIVVLDDLSTGYADNLDGTAARLVRGSVLDAESLTEAANGADVIVHLAALGSVPRSVENPVATHEANATGTLRVLEAARAGQNTMVILASSSSVYGANPQLPKREDQLLLPMSPYAVSKLAAEQYAVAFARCYDLDVLPLRFFNVYGPRQRAGHDYAAVIPVFLDAALRGKPLPINGDGRQSRDFTFVDTVTDILTAAIIRRVVGGPTNLAFGSRTTLRELSDLIAEVLDRDLDVEWRPPRSGDVMNSRADNSQLIELFGEIEPVSLASGLRVTAEWMQETLRTETRTA